MNQRGSGILLHISSLPSPFGIGDLGPWAYKFVDFLAETKQRYWQILPLNPTGLDNGNSPYSSVSAFAGNPLLISPELIFHDHLLLKMDIMDIPDFPGIRVDYPSVIAYKKYLFNLAYERFKTKGNDHNYEDFCSKNSYWLDDFALFSAIKDHFKARTWLLWARDIRDRHPESLKCMQRQLSERIGFEKFLQYIFFTQWMALKDYCNKKNVQIIGDIPIYVDYNSVDVWTRPELFRLNNEKELLAVAGVPPDYFSSTGQLWGNPVYHWDAHKKESYAWWKERIGHNLRLFDLVRIDHFRGFTAYWEVLAGEKTAINGRWIKTPGKELFNTMVKHFPHLPIIAEDLGMITEDVRELMACFGFPGMKILIFAFGDDIPSNPYAPHNHIKDCIVYTGTHDNNTVKGWFEEELSEHGKERLSFYLGREVNSDEISYILIRLAMMSVANMAIFPMQDLLGLGSEARMNLPSTPKGNWEWRVMEGQLTPQLSKTLAEMTEIYGRA